jgi:phage shock protein C
MERRLYRSQDNRMIGGVCGGLGAYLGIDATVVRLFFVLLAFGNGIGMPIYLLLWIVMPPADLEKDTSFSSTVRTGSEEIAAHAREMGEELRTMVRNPNPQASLVVGAALIIMGVIFLAQSLRLPWLIWLDFDIILAIMLIFGGVLLLWRNRKSGGKK